MSSVLNAAKPANQTLADRVLHDIQARIVDGDLAPGTKLNEEELASAHGISRGPLREAIRRLEARRLVEVAPHVGARVVHLDRAQLEAVYETREALEGMAARLAAQRIDRAGVAGLHALLDEHESRLAQDAGRGYLQEQGDYDFHYRLSVASGNALLVGMLCDDLYHLVRMIRRRTALNPGRAAAALAEHRHIVEALGHGDGELAELLMRRHVACARRLLGASDSTDANLTQPSTK